MAEIKDISVEEMKLLSKQMKAVAILNNALYFKDNSDYETAMWQAMSVMTGINYSEMDNVELTYLEEQ